MKANIQKMLEQTLNMPASDRAAIAECLIASLDATTDQDVEEAWQQEVQRRLTEIDNSVVECIPWEEVVTRMQKT